MTTTMTVQGNNANWTDSGVNVPVNGYFTLSGAGGVDYIGSGNLYDAQGSLVGSPPSIASGQVSGQWWACPGVARFALCAAVTLDGYPPTRPYYNGFGTGTYNCPRGGRLWLIANDTNYSDNSGAYTASIDYGTGTYKMPIRGTDQEANQIGCETTPGTLVPGSLRLQATKLMIDAVTPTNLVLPAGANVPVDVTSEKEHSEFSIDGTLSFYDIIYLLAGYCNLPYVVANSGAATAYDWRFRPKTFGVDAVQTFSIEQGSNAGAQKAAFALIQSLDIKIDDKTAKVTGKGICNALLSTAVVLTASPTLIPDAPVSADSVNLYVATSVAGLATGQVVKSDELNLTLPERWLGHYGLTSSNKSYNDYVMKATPYVGQIIVPQDSVADGYLASLRNKDLLYARFECLGANIPGTTVPHRIAMTFPFKFKAAKRGDKNSVYAGTYDMQLVHDPAFMGVGCALDILVTNGLAAAASGIGTVGTI